MLYFSIITYHETVDAEIKAVMLSKRARAGESRAENKLSNGPLRAHSKESFSEYYATLPA